MENADDRGEKWGDLLVPRMKKYKSRQNTELEDFLLVFFAQLTGTKKLNKAHGITPLHQSTPETFQIEEEEKNSSSDKLD